MDLGIVHTKINTTTDQIQDLTTCSRITVFPTATVPAFPANSDFAPPRNTTRNAKPEPPLSCRSALSLVIALGNSRHFPFQVSAKTEKSVKKYAYAKATCVFHNDDNNDNKATPSWPHWADQLAPPKKHWIHNFQKFLNHWTSAAHQFSERKYKPRFSQIESTKTTAPNESSSPPIQYQ